MTLLAFAVPLASCTLANLRTDTRAYETDAVLVGRVSGPPGWHGPVDPADLGEVFSSPLPAGE